MRTSVSRPFSSASASSVIVCSAGVCAEHLQATEFDSFHSATSSAETQSSDASCRRAQLLAATSIIATTVAIAPAQRFATHIQVHRDQSDAGWETTCRADHTIPRPRQVAITMAVEPGLEPMPSIGRTRSEYRT
jgi:hypothetical protein